MLGPPRKLQFALQQHCLNIAYIAAVLVVCFSRSSGTCIDGSSLIKIPETKDTPPGTLALSW